MLKRNKQGFCYFFIKINFFYFRYCFVMFRVVILIYQTKHVACDINSRTDENH